MDSRENHRFEAILSSLVDAVIIIGARGSVDWMNAAAEAMFGKSLTSVRGKGLETLLGDSGALRAEVEKALKSGDTYIDYDLRLETPGADPAPVMMSVQRVEEQDAAGVVVVLRNLTGLKALETSVKLTERVAEIATLAAGIAHEIKNPLSGIRGAAQLLNRELGEGSAADFTGLIIRESDRIDRLIMDLIELNQPGDFPREPVNIYPILDEALKLTAATRQGKHARVFLEYDPSLPPVLGDQDRLMQVFLNLVKNAVESLGEGGALTLRTGMAWRAPGSAGVSKERKYALIEVIDDGHGIPEDALPRLFTPFFSTKKGGSGLGLPMTLHIVQAHGGLLTINNRTDMRGAVASVYLPYRLEKE